MNVQKFQPIIIGNWKMNKTIRQAVEFISKLASELPNPGPLVYLAVPYISIPASVEAAQGSSIKIGAQNINEADSGAFTGEIAAIMVEQAGAEFVLLGHSERRRLFNETNEMINSKIFRALESHIQPIVCVGESLEERNSGKTEEVLKGQLERSLKGLKANQISKCCIAYEPVWAIGTGKTATPEIAQASHAFCRKVLSNLFDQETAELIPLLYGGSVTKDNTAELLKQSDIEGLLVGGASLSLDSFLGIIRNSHHFVSAVHK